MNKDVEILENNIIGAFIVDKDTHKYIKELSEDMFISNNSKQLFKIIKDMYISKEKINLISVNNKFANGVTEETTILNKIIKITDDVVTTSNIKSNIEKLKDINKRKALQDIVVNLNRDIKDVNKSIDEIKKDLIKAVNNIKTEEIKVADNIQDALIKTLSSIEEKKNKGDDYSLYTGFFELDKYTDGLHNSELTCIGARPAVGKTAFGLNIATNIAKRGKKVYYCSLEMSSEQITQRIIARYTSINSQFLRNGRIQDDEMLKIATKTNDILKLNLKIDSKSRYIEEIENIAINLKEKEEIDVLIIDYLTLLKSKEKFAIRELEVANISRKLKLLALDLKIPVVILVQLNRDAENKVPTMANIRESGSIEQNCDNIIFLHSEDSNKLVAEMTIILEKQRQGATGSFKLKFDKKYSKFVNLER